MNRVAPSAWSLCSGLVLCLAVLAGPARAEPPPACDVLPSQLSLDAAVQWALEHNPELAAIRQQHGIAAAGVVIARTYPFNPAWEQRVQGAGGPANAGITNRVPNGTLVLLELEIRGQGRYRRQGAAATLSRTDWDIATQELNLAVRVSRAFYTLLYRQEKLRLIEEAIGLNEHAAERLQLLIDAGRAKLRPDLIVLRTEIDDARSQLGPGRAAVETARYELFRALGVTGAAFDLAGPLEIVPPEVDPAMLLQAAVSRRPDLHSRQAAIAEAEAQLRLEVANRFGNPTVGPAYELNETSVHFIGAQFTLPLPVLNTHRGEILQRQAQVGRAALELRETQVAVEQDVQAAVTRLETARRSAGIYRTQILPSIRESLDALEQLFAQADPNVDVPRVLDVRRKLIRARDGYLDALWELTQAWADLAAAVGDPTLMVVPCTPPPVLAPLGPGAQLPDPKDSSIATAPEPANTDVLSLPVIQLRPCGATERPAPPPHP
jgi:cobalt-zinc-cadmium efflux system outer membrane protein